ncbi:MAG: sigma factor [Patescibacteria group bacterium]
MVIEHAARTVDTAEGITPRQPLLSMVVLEPLFLGRTISEANIPLIFQGRETSTEREVVLEAKAGEDQAQACIYVAYHDRVALYVLARTGRIETAEDLAGDTMGKVLSSVGGFEFREGIEFSSWVFRIAHNLVASFYRKMGRQGQELLVRLQMTWITNILPPCTKTILNCKLSGNYYMNLLSAK